MKPFKLLLILLVAALALPACANSPAYSTDPGYYFSHPAQLALAVAAGRGDIEAMQEALNQGADPNAPGKDGMTPLFWSATDTMGANIEGFRYLLEHGGDPNLVVVDDGKPGVSTIYLIAQAYKNPDPAFLEAALEAGADPNTEVSESETLLFERHTDSYLDQIKLLIAHGAEVNHRGRFQEPPLMSAIYGKEYQTALALVKAGADPTLANEVNGSTALGFIKSMYDRESRNPGLAYTQLIELLQEKGYLDESY